MPPPIYVKGGQWTNVEDQILKAAVSKYGLTQWARVASLLPKKTAKQAKARWTEYLNPNIKRDEWSLEEDEQLLRLAKLMPNQWRSISPVMGRTPAQCVERYQQLLDRTMGLNQDEVEEAEDDLKLAGPGIETMPALRNSYESLPSRPDMEEMDEDEQEMLSEATARLWNTLGKKAKRKERERMMRENRRVTLLEKRRELKAAGVRMSLESKNKKRRKEFDYNADIPHEHKPPPGLFDTTEEDAKNERERLAFQEKVNFKGMDAPEEKKIASEKDEEAKANKRSRQRISEAGKLFAEADEQNIKRRKLDLPAPGTTSADIMTINNRISDSSIKILQSQNKTSDFPEKVDNVNNKETKKPSIRKLQKVIQSMLAQIPEPKNEADMQLPQFDVNVGLSDDISDSEVAIPPKSDVQQTTSSSNLVVLRGLSIPDPKKLKSLDEQGCSELDKAIAHEFAKLIQADYTKYVDPALNSSGTLEDMDFKNVQREIGEELKRTVAPELTEENFILPRTKAAVDECFRLLESLHASATDIDSQLDSNASEYSLALEEKYTAIATASLELQAESINEAVLGFIGSLEGEAIQNRAKSLTELVAKTNRAKSTCLT
ncbi:hypothetical_protein [Candidozyma auris]|uniref:hypothetical_protein n=1 Tax=Candidozyma auris TaxID=498019 RepID=UPI000D29D080|nr:hypothetical_protein [[Candida] auris]QEO20903.1 hypothetical_protein [[Candida] auris]GBL48578.1 hypothetical protein CAJCM15448_08520 [[Candida] auris]